MDITATSQNRLETLLLCSVYWKINEALPLEFFFLFMGKLSQAWAKQCQFVHLANRWMS